MARICLSETPGLETDPAAVPEKAGAKSSWSKSGAAARSIAA